MEDLPKLDVPEKFEPFSNVSVDRKNEKYFRNFDNMNKLVDGCEIGLIEEFIEKMNNLRKKVRNLKYELSASLLLRITEWIDIETEEWEKRSKKYD